MRNALALAGLAGLLGCGVPLEQYDARGNELRKVEEELAHTRAAERQARQSVSQLERQLDASQAHLAEVERVLHRLGVHGAADTAPIERAMADERSAKSAASRQSVEQSQLSAGLKDEIEAGVVRVEERDGAVRLVMPEEGVFAPNAARLGPPGRKLLEGVARELSRLPYRRLLIASHTDDRARGGGLALSLERSRQVAEQLAQMGVEAGRMAAAGFGAYDPLVDEPTDDARARNRRLELVLIQGRDYVPLSQRPTREVAAAPPPRTPPPRPTAAVTPPKKPTPPPKKPATPALDDPGLQ